MIENSLGGCEMPDLSKCVKYEGKTYCFDRVNKTVVEVKITDVPFNEVPESVLVSMLSRITSSKE
jgi:hypothetical protein